MVSTSAYCSFRLVGVLAAGCMSTQLELWMQACRGQLLRTLQAFHACAAAAQFCYNKREDHRPFVSAGIARWFARLLLGKTCKARLPALLLAFASP
jgi:Tfp pilus assembly protein PilP